MAKVKTSDKVAYTPRKSDDKLALTNGIVIGTVEAVEENGVLLNDGTTTALVSNNPRRFKKLPAADVVPTVTKTDKSTVSVVRKPGEKTVTVTTTTKAKTPRPGSKKHRAIEIYQEVNGDRTDNLDRTTVKARFETELELGTKGSSTYYQNIKSRKNGWWI